MLWQGRMHGTLVAWSSWSALITGRQPHLSDLIWVSWSLQLPSLPPVTIRRSRHKLSSEITLILSTWTISFLSRLRARRVSFALHHAINWCVLLSILHTRASLRAVLGSFGCPSCCHHGRHSVPSTTDTWRKRQGYFYINSVMPTQICRQYCIKIGWIFMKVWQFGFGRLLKRKHFFSLY